MSIDDTSLCPDFGNRYRLCPDFGWRPDFRHRLRWRWERWVVCPTGLFIGGVSPSFSLAPLRGDENIDRVDNNYEHSVSDYEHAVNGVTTAT